MFSNWNVSPQLTRSSIIFLLHHCTGGGSTVRMVQLHTTHCTLLTTLCILCTLHTTHFPHTLHTALLPTHTSLPFLSAISSLVLLIRVFVGFSDDEEFQKNDGISVHGCHKTIPAPKRTTSQIHTLSFYLVTLLFYHFTLTFYLSCLFLHVIQF